MPYKDPEQSKEYQREYNKKNAERIRLRRQTYHLANKERENARSRNWVANHLENKKELDKAYYLANKDKFKNTRLLKSYGITLEQFNQMYLSQDGKCAICAISISKDGETLVDHNHSTGQVRQLLCNKCNTGIGNFMEQPQLLDKAKEYLLRWNN